MAISNLDSHVWTDPVDLDALIPPARAAAARVSERTTAGTVGLRPPPSPLPGPLRRDLERLLAAHVPADGRERRHTERIRRFVASHADPYARENPRGHLTASAFILDPAGRLLLLRHRKLGMWLQPGGHADDDRSPWPAALREALEETGLDDLRPHPAFGRALLDVDVHPIPAHGTTAAHEHFDLRFAFVTESASAICIDPRESTAAAWWTADEVRAHFDEGVRRAHRTLRST